MSIEVKVSIENGKSRIFLLEDEDLTLKNLREKIKEKRWEAAGSKFCFLKNNLDLRVYFDGFKNRYTGEHLSERIDYAEESSLKSLEKAAQDFLKEEKVKERLTEFLQNK